MSNCMKSSSWNKKEEFSEGCAICKPPAIFIVLELQYWYVYLLIDK